MPRDTTTRPSFDRATFEAEAAKVMPPEPTQQDGDNLPRFLNKIAINLIIIALAEAIGVVYQNNGDNFFFEIALISYTIDFLQRRVDLKNPEMIKKFAFFFRSTVEQYSVRYYDEKGREFINASLGEIDRNLYSKLNPKLTLFMTAFYTKSCLTSPQNDDPINHIVDDNHTMEYMAKKILRNVFQCMNNAKMSLERVQEIMDEYIVRADVHIQGGVVGEGNDFESFLQQVNDDEGSPLYSFCEDNIDDLKLKEGIKFNNKKINSCQPILIDMILGILNMALYAAYVYATGSVLNILLASKRSEIIFQPDRDGEYRLGLIHESEFANIVQSDHPNNVERFLSTRMPSEIIQLDKGITIVLKPLNNNATFCWRESDFFQRLYVIRKSGNKEEEIDYELLEEAKDKLDEMEAKLEEETEELEEEEAKFKEAMVDLKIKKGKAEALNRELNEQQRENKKTKREQNATDAEDELLKLQSHHSS